MTVDMKSTAGNFRGRNMSRESTSPQRGRPKARSVEKGYLLPAVYPQKGKVQYFKELEELKGVINVAEERNRQLKTKILSQLV